jgi:hypothetical protein
MAIAIEGNFNLSLSIGEFEDFINPTEIVYFAITEPCGNILPYFELTFKSGISKLSSLLNTGQDMLCQFGRDRNSLINITLEPKKYSRTREATSEYLYQVKGFISQGKYLSNSEINIIPNSSSIQAASSIINRYFKINTNIDTPTNDVQTWINPNRSHRRFVSDILMRTFIPNSFISFAIMANNTFIIKDMKKELNIKKVTPDWYIGGTGKNIDQNKVLDIKGDYIFFNDTGITTDITAYDQLTQVFNVDSGDDFEIARSSTNVLSLSQNIPKDNSIKSKFIGSELQNRNVHTNYQLAYNNNFIGNVSLSASKLSVVINQGYKNIKPLDIVSFKEPDTENVQQSNEYTSGLYVVSKVQKKIVDLRCVIVLELCRESTNRIVNDAN